MDYTVTRNADASCYETFVEGAHCVLNYHQQGKTLVIDHVGVPEVVTGRGIAAALTKKALDTARFEGMNVIARCPYVAAYIKKHADYQDLLHTDS